MSFATVARDKKLGNLPSVQFPRFASLVELSVSFLTSFFPILPGKATSSRAHFTKGINVAMTKSIDAIAEIVRNPKPSFRKADDRPAKAQKHRYERRKIKEYIKISSWVQEGPAPA
jgi:hypothetical protein